MPRLAVAATAASPGGYPSQHAWRKHGLLHSLPVSTGGPLPTALWTRARALCLVGPAGSGKTALLRHLERHAEAPVRRLSAGGGTGDDDGDAWTPADADEPGAWVMIDDVAADDVRRLGRRLRRRFPRQRLVVATRGEPSGDGVPGFEVLRLLPWSPRMVEDWLLGDDDRLRHVERGTLAAAVRRVLDLAPDLPPTPLLLQLLADLAARCPPTAWTLDRIYGEYARLLLKRRPGSDAFHLVEEEVQLDLVCGLAGDDDVLPPARALARLRDWLPRLGWKADSAAAVLADLGLATGILQSRAGGIAFLCLGLQDLAAGRRRRHLPPPSGAQPAVRAAGDPFHEGRLAAARRAAFEARDGGPPEERRQLAAELLGQFWKGRWDFVQEQALTALAWLAHDGVSEHLSQALGSRSAHLRARAAEALCRLGGPPAADALRRALDDIEWKVRIHAVEGLGRWGTDADGPRLVQALAAGHWQVRMAAAEALGWRAVEGSVPALAEALQAGHRSRQHCSADAFARWGWPVAAALSRKAADDQDLALRLRAAEALRRIGTPAARKALHGPHTAAAAVAADAVQAKDGDTEALERLRRHAVADDDRCRYRAALAAAFVPFVCTVGYQRDERGVLRPLAPVLTRLLRDDAWCVRGAAAVALGSQGEAVAALPVIDRLSDGDHFVRANAAVGLGMAGCTRAIPALERALTDGEAPETARAYAGRALGVLGASQAVPALAQALGSGGILLRLNAAQGLGDVGGPEQLEPLLARAIDDDEPSVRNAAFAAAYRVCTRHGIDARELADPATAAVRPVIDTICLIQRYV